ncbi:MAG: hypothetical protein PHY24_03905 [Candidatus Cloacimonetes bacterium]|nr:hypothetical protein [Candidatus Cloacimonadota bacterium]
MKLTIIVVLVVSIVSLLTLASCERSETFVQPELMSSKKLNSGELHNMKLDEMYYALEQLRDSNTTLNVEECEDFLQSQFQQMLLCDAIFSTTECYNDFVDVWGTRPIHSDVHDLVDYCEAVVDTAYSESAIEFDEKMLIYDLIQIQLISANDISEDIVNLSDLYNEAIIEGFEEKYPIYYNAVEIAYCSAMYWEQEADKWNQVLCDVYNGEGDPTQINDIRVLWGADLVGGIIGGVGSGYTGGSTADIIIGIIGGAIVGSTGFPGSLFYALATLTLQHVF